MKAGWKTSEFWIVLLGQALTLLALTGAISVGDKEHLETALANAVTAVFTILGSTVVVSRYIRSRSALKSQALAQPGEPRSPLLPVVLLTGLLLAGPLHAAPPTQPTCFFGHRQQRTDPALLAALQQLAQNQQTIIALLQQQRAPAPAPPLLLLAPQTLPLGGAPRQDIPLGGAPRQDIPLGGAPRQDIPLGPAPRQEVPLGPPPRQQIPLGELKPAPTALQRYLSR